MEKETTAEEHDQGCGTHGVVEITPSSIFGVAGKEAQLAKLEFSCPTGRKVDKKAGKLPLLKRKELEQQCTIDGQISTNTGI